MTTSEKISRSLWLISLVLVYFYFWITLNVVVEPVPVHFDWSGQPNGWMTLSQFTTFFPVLLGGLNFLLVFLLPILFKKMPYGLINIPNKDYWLKTDQMRKETYSRLRTITDSSALFINLIFVLSLDVITKASIGNSLLERPTFVMVSLIFVFIFVLFWWTRKAWSIPK